jgi:hypothetical protein
VPDYDGTVVDTRHRFNPASETMSEQLTRSPAPALVSPLRPAAARQYGATFKLGFLVIWN